MKRKVRLNKLIKRTKAERSIKEEERRVRRWSVVRRTGHDTGGEIHDSR